MASAMAERSVALRPHVKTHKSVRLARLQLEAGAAGITVGTLGEAEVMADAGIGDIVRRRTRYGRVARGPRACGRSTSGPSCGSASTPRRAPRRSGRQCAARPDRSRCSSRSTAGCIGRASPTPMPRCAWRRPPGMPGSTSSAPSPTAAMATRRRSGHAPRPPTRSRRSPAPVRPSSRPASRFACSAPDRRRPRSTPQQME